MVKLLKIDRRNFLLILVVFIVFLIVGLWLPYARSRNAPLPVDSKGNAEIIISYTKKGFEPESTSVQIGSTVAWVNSSGRPMWVASDPHPAHTDLKGFDQLKIINKRKTNPFFQKVYAHGDAIYEYTFEKLGSWKYHNHVYPQDRGVIEVIEKPQL